MVTTLPFNFTEVSPKSGGDRSTEFFDLKTGETGGTRHFIGPWDNRLDFVYDYLMGRVDGGNGNTTRLAPKRHPYLKSCFVSKISIDGLGVGTYDADDEKTVWERAKVTVEYSKEVSSQDDGQDNEENNIADWKYIDESIDSNLELLTVPGKDLADDGGKNLHDKGNFHKVIVLLTLVIKQKAIISPNWLAIANCLGKINSQLFISSSGFICPIATLRYDGPSAFTKVNVFDRSGILDEDIFPVPLWEVSHKFEFNPNGWNKRFNAELARWVDIVPVLYQSSDFLNIFFGNKLHDVNLIVKLADLQGLMVLLNNLVDQGLNLADPQIQNVLAEIQVIKASLGFKV